VLHAPSRSDYKGSAEIRETIGKLQDKGLQIDFVELSGKTNEEIISEIRKCDLVVDQLYADYALNALPTESAWFGKPVLTCGYSADLWKKLIPAEFLPPVTYCEPSEFETKLEELILNKELREKLGKELQDYIRRQHHPRIVAERYLQIADGNAPKEWFYDPKKMREIWGGFFMPRERARAITRELIQKHGVGSLCLGDKPVLENTLVEWANLSLQ
jgi:glycosyltransferase involved in cell wall biosynthesis